MKTAASFALVAALLPSATLAQGTFVNLDFEAATVPYLTNSARWVSAADAFPGWTVSTDNTPNTLVPYNGMPSGSGYVGLTANSYIRWMQQAGRYSAWFMPWEGSSCSLMQTGTVPGDAKSLQFVAGNLSARTPLTVTFDGQVLPASLVWSDVMRAGYSVDVSPYAGTTGELRFTVSVDPSGSGWRDSYLDNLVFVPEPQVWQLLGLAGAAWGVRAWRRGSARRSDNGANRTGGADK